MALSASDLEAIEALIKQRSPASETAKEPMIVKPDVAIGDIITKVATAGLVAGMGWLITSVSSMKTTQALIAQEQNNQKVVIERVEQSVAEGTRDRYPRAEAIRDTTLINTRIDEFVQKQKEGFSRIEQIEQELAIMKATNRAN